MKKIICLAFLCFTLANLEAQNKALSIVSGTWNRRGPAEISLFYVTMGRLEKLASYSLQDDQTFGFAFTPAAEGYYVIGTGNGTNRTGKYTFYFKQGDHLNLAVNDTSYTLVDGNTKENIAMTAWHDYMWPLERDVFKNLPYKETYVDYFPIFEEKTKQFYRAENTGNKVFDESFAKYRKFDLMHCATQFVLVPRSAHPEGADFPDYYKTIKFGELTANADVLNYPYPIYRNVSFIESRVSGQNMIDPKSLIDSAKDETIKGELVLSYLSGVRKLPEMEELKAKYGSYITTDDQKRRLAVETERIMKLFLAQGEGKPGQNFTYKDVNGKDVSFSDFKGKVVYIDVWATWCGPCRKEIPHMKELEKKYHGNKDIAIISISSDKIEDIQKWKDFVAKEQLPGIQLHGRTTGSDDILKLYQIPAIPRFMLFDKQGNIVSVDAPAPSSAELLPLLTRLLK